MTMAWCAKSLDAAKGLDLDPGHGHTGSQTQIVSTFSDRVSLERMGDLATPEGVNTWLIQHRVHGGPS
jgi:hypothetical protein